LEAGAEDYKQSGDVWEISCEPSVYETLRQMLADAGLETQSAELAMVPSSTVSVDAEAGQKLLKLIEALEEHDDVQNVYSNFDLPEQVMTAMENE